jgi:hypothetical protein
MSEKAWDVAREAWRASKSRNKPIDRRCRKCWDVWKSNGSKEADKPPVFPPDYVEKCPDCDSELCEPHISI